jgi:hypothetical protein
MSDLTRKILSSGLVDEYTATLMEKWGYLPEGAAAIAKDKENVLKNATKEQLTKLAEDIGDEIERKARLKESMLDLDKIRWPAMVSIWNAEGVPLAHHIGAVIDRLGRYYFRPADVKSDWLVPGFSLTRTVSISTDFQNKEETETILEVTSLYVDETVMAIQVSTKHGG